ncbi:hypothetical protein OHS59_43320 [Streptomyces sp. NBC_00414]|uniref:hypothetical protein n=1 Tax=Streptomyces sp. NBC_00414 TaxID=2975739 RepID=UPI002E2016EC
MSEQHGRDWTSMTPDDFDQDAPLRPDVRAGPAAVLAVPDECGTAPLFGDETPAALPQGAKKRPSPHFDQPELF